MVVCDGFRDAHRLHIWRRRRYFECIGPIDFRVGLLSHIIPMLLLKTRVSERSCNKRGKSLLVTGHSDRKRLPLLNLPKPSVLGYASQLGNLEWYARMLPLR